jgi:hypothetical protein
MQSPELAPLMPHYSPARFAIAQGRAAHAVITTATYAHGRVAAAVNGGIVRAIAKSPALHGHAGTAGGASTAIVAASGVAMIAALSVATWRVHWLRRRRREE